MGKTIDDPAVMRYDTDGRPVYCRRMAPPGLATAAQLRTERLSVAGLAPAAWLYYTRLGYRTCALYKRAQARPIRPLTTRQRDALAEDRVCAAVWAAEVLADPNTVFLDTETTGLLGGPEPSYAVEIAVVDVSGAPLLDTLLNPRRSIPQEAIAKHQITDSMVADAPTFSEVLPELTRVLEGRRVIIYNSEFDRGILTTELERHYRVHDPFGASSLWSTHPAACQWMATLRTECAMQRYAEWHGDWDEKRQRYRWQRLDGDHRARGDCQAIVPRLRVMASTAFTVAAA
ncbi:exonuclease domain-containing protein [Saccharopolyspora griseoalba]|uniref:Exonuclease domain-containing protein n=1 Tax=Saccharopolyspora griseoalba TaxID=1431848 RepID=A0ABW2LPQ2_9PSEU